MGMGAVIGWLAGTAAVRSKYRAPCSTLGSPTVCALAIKHWHPDNGPPLPDGAVVTSVWATTVRSRFYFSTAWSRSERERVYGQVPSARQYSPLRNPCTGMRVARWWVAFVWRKSCDHARLGPARWLRGSCTGLRWDWRWDGDWERLARLGSETGAGGCSPALLDGGQPTHPLLPTSRQAVGWQDIGMCNAVGLRFVV